MTRICRALGLACALGFGFGAPGCKGQADEQARVAIAVAVEIAPIAEDHPWVISFLTKVATESPPGVNARLEGRPDLNGRSSPEPIFEAQTREALGEFLTSYEATHARPPELAPVWEREPFGPDQGPAWRLHFIDRQAGFVLDAEASAAIQSGAAGPTVVVRLSPAQREIFAALTREYLGRRAAFMIDGEVVMVPTIRTPIPGGEVQITQSPSQDPEIAAPALLNRLAGR